MTATQPALKGEKVVISIFPASPGRINNFDLIRLLAALQVVFHHTFTFFDLTDVYPVVQIVHEVIAHFPGVPIFFTISGFLVYWSFERNSDQVTKYLKNRALRIYPALWVCLAITLLLVGIFNQYDARIVMNENFWVYILTQGTVFQSYFPPLSPDFGHGIPNGALWTITVELQFYLVIPLIFFFCNFDEPGKRAINLRLILLFVASYAFALWAKGIDKSTLLGQMLFSNVAPYLFNFLIGVLIYVNFGSLRRLLEGKMRYWFGAFVLYTLVVHKWFDSYHVSYWPDLAGLPATFLLSMTVISAAYTQPRLSGKLLRGNDISYGVYIYHLLIINALLALGFKEQWWLVFPVLSATMLIAYLSWVFVEKPVLKLK
jgi:peptidoglycan/LPS O-acetylase OafA/YrhL